MILKNVKIRNYTGYKNLFDSPNNMSPQLFAGITSALYPQLVWRGGSNGPISVSPVTPPNNLPGNAIQFTGVGDGNNVYISKVYPYSRQTTYKAFVWARYVSGTVPTTSIINAVIGGCVQRSFTVYPPTFGNGEWHYIEHTFKTLNVTLNSACSYKLIFFADETTSNTTIQLYGGGVNVIEPGPDFYTDYPFLQRGLIE